MLRLYRYVQFPGSRSLCVAAWMTSLWTASLFILSSAVAADADSNKSVTIAPVASMPAALAPPLTADRDLGNRLNFNWNIRD